MNTQSTSSIASIQASSLPMIFIVLWSSGYIGGAIGILYAEPFTMTFLRFALAITRADALEIPRPLPERSGDRFRDPSRTDRSKTIQRTHQKKKARLAPCSGGSLVFEMLAGLSRTDAR
ncbi:hypothetical protein [Salinarimonas chemoclinalis]|uniref:hypothetical protein n=1 Tax=Salinarimonas chemoclinalis TaxID=3241599 RepID=UPI003558E397